MLEKGEIVPMDERTSYDGICGGYGRYHVLDNTLSE